MTAYTGTNGADTLIGSTDNDLFYPLLGGDTVSGAAGLDTLYVDWSSIVANGGSGTITASSGSLSGSLLAGGGTTSLSFSGMEALVATLTAGSDRITIDAAALGSGAAISVNGGAGFDTLVADFSAFASTSFALGVNFLITANHGSWAGFEQFDVALGGGTNVVTLQAGNDTVRSTGGVDTLDLGAGRDTWIADFSGWSSGISFGWDGNRNLAAVSNGTYVQRVEGGQITGGSGDDAFFLNGANGFAVDGGAGRDLLVWDESGFFTEPYSAAFLAGAGGTFEGWVRASTFSGIEQVNVALSDADNSAYVDTAALAAGATMNLDGGLGTDTLEVEFSGFASTTFAVDASGTAQTSHGTYSNFEHFAMALGAGTNTVTTGAGDDTIYSLGGADQIDAGTGFDLWGGDYSDHTEALAFTWNGSGSATLSNGTTLAGFETGYIIGGSGNDLFQLSGLLVFDVYGGAGTDTLVRNDGGLTGLATESYIFAATGWFWGFAGNGQFDEIENLSVTFGNGDDTVYVDAAPLAAGASLSLNGGVGADTLLLDLSSLSGSVFTVGTSGSVTGNRGTYAGFEAYSIGLGGGTNAITLGSGNDSVQAAFGGTSAIDLGAGDDSVWGGTGSETVLGGAGTDRFYISGTKADFSVTQDGLGGYWLTDLNLADGNEGTDRLTGVEWVVFDDATFELPAYSAVGVTRTGTAGADILTGTAYNDTLIGLAGNDTLSGGNGDDTLNGGLGNDTITGGGGIDLITYADSTAGVQVNLAITGTGQATGAGAGTDLLVDALENLIGSAYADTLTGNALANRIEGLAGNDNIDGGLGADTLVGGLGNDTYTVDNAADTVIEAAGEGTDLVNAATSFVLSATLENLTLTGTTAINGTGNAVANVINGNAAANLLAGLDGADTLSGNAGDDILIGGRGADILTGGTGLDRFRFDVFETAANKDTIKDFVHGTDKIELLREAFSGLEGFSAGALGAAAFTTGKAATTSAHHLIYTQNTGALYYDADGAGGAAMVQIATLSTKPVLDAGDFWLV